MQLIYVYKDTDILRDYLDYIVSTDGHWCQLNAKENPQFGVQQRRNLFSANSSASFVVGLSGGKAPPVPVETQSGSRGQAGAGL